MKTHISIYNGKTAEVVQYLGQFDIEETQKPAFQAIRAFLISRGYGVRWYALSPEEIEAFNFVPSIELIQKNVATIQERLHLRKELVNNGEQREKENENTSSILPPPCGNDSKGIG